MSQPGGSRRKKVKMARVKTKTKVTNLTVLAAGGLLASVFNATADTVELTQNPALSFGDGGAFDAVTATANFAQFYAPEALDGNAFQTFCVEQSVLFWPEQPYYYVLAQSDSQGRTLTMGAAFLYFEFATGKLTGYFGGNLATEAGLLQSAIWGLQGGQTGAGFPDYTTDAFYQLALNQFGGVAGATAPSDGAYNVDIMQLWGSTTSQVAGQNDFQNQLVYLGVPDTASNAALLGGAVAGMALVSRRLKYLQAQPAVVRSHVS